MTARIEDQLMTAEYDGRVVATARYSPEAAADGQGGWSVSGLPRRLFTWNQAITIAAHEQHTIFDDTVRGDICAVELQCQV